MEFSELITKKENDTEEVEDVNENILNRDCRIKIEVKKERMEEDWSIQNVVKTSEFNDLEPVAFKEMQEFCYQKCSLCDSIFPNIYELLQHKAKHLQIMLETPDLYQCDDCLVCYTEISKLTNHIYTKHVKKHDKSDNNNSELRKNSMQPCEICQKTYKYKAWHSHMKEVHGVEEFKCKKCNLVFKCGRYLKKHNAVQHEGVRPSWKFPAISNARCTSASSVVKCDYCNKTFIHNLYLKLHIKNCHGEPAECEICKSKLKSKTYLLAHMRRVHYNDGKKHKCEICFKEFKSPRYVNIHVKNSHENKPQEECEYCSRSFKTAQTFKTHVQNCRRTTLNIKIENV